MSWASVKQALARQTFHYDPLDLVEKQIRLLILYGSHPDAPHSGQAELRIVTLGTGTSYEALSYQWGTSQADQSIIINDQPKAITPNLALALRCLRLEMRERVLWVDAICIDQKNLKEKSSQVQMMNRIYFQAQEVLIWLGRPGPSLDGKQHDERQAFDTIKRIASAVRERGEGYVNYNTSSILNFDDLSSLWHLCTREYWTRIWIIQEVGLAARATIYCCYDKLSERDHGEDVLSAPWDDFLATIRETRMIWLFEGRNAMDPSTKEIVEAITHSLPAQLDKRICDLAGQLTLYDLLSISRDSKSQKRQDRVFGLLGLSNDSEGELLADYRQSPHAVYRRVMEFYHAESRFGLFDAAKMIELSRMLLQNLGLKSEVWWRSTRSDLVFEIPGMLKGTIEGLCPAFEKDSRQFALPDELLSGIYQMCPAETVYLPRHKTL